MRAKARRTTNSARSGKRTNSESTPAAFAEASTSDTPRSAGNGDSTKFAPGDRVYVKGQGKLAFGTVCFGREVPDHLWYRCDFNQGEHLVKVKNVRAIQKRRATQ